MKPLLEIKTVPISIQYKTTPAHVERKNMTAELEITRDKKGLSIKSRPIRLNVDSFEAKNSISPSPTASVRDNGEYGMQLAYKATATIAQEGNMMVNIHLRQDVIPQIAHEKTIPPLAEANIKYLPDKPINIDWIPGEMQIEYEMDKLNFDWKTGQNDFEFTPASIEFTIAEHPHVVITYVGSPIYVPPSANPNYEPIVDLHA